MAWTMSRCAHILVAGCHMLLTRWSHEDDKWCRMTMAHGETEEGCGLEGQRGGEQRGEEKWLLNQLKKDREDGRSD